MAKRTGEKIIAENRKAKHDYHLSDFTEAGLVLTGTEVKSCRDGRANLRQAYAEIRNGEAWLVGAHISVYEQGNLNNHEPERPRKLLLHRHQMEDFFEKVREKGFTLVPTRMYFKDGRAKVEIALAKGKDLHDKRHDVMKRDAEREIQRAFKDARY